MEVLLVHMATVARTLLGDPRNAATGLFGLAVCTVAYAYASRARQLGRTQTLSLRVELLADTIVIVPFDRWSSITKKGISVALQLAGQIRVLHVEPTEKHAELESLWEQNVVSPLKVAGKKVPELVILRDAKSSISPMANYILAAEREDPNRQVIVVMPQLEVRHWWQRPLHNYRNRMLKMMLAARASQRLMVIDVPWYL